MTSKLTYAQAGVNIDAGNALVDKIKPLARATDRAGTLGGIGGFGALFDLKAAGYTDPILISSTDGVGTKLKIAQQVGRHDTIGIDLVAMCVNDLVVQGGEPLFFLDYFATGTLSVGVAESVIRGIAQGCSQAGCALVGGETAEMPGMYAAGEYDLAGFAVGAAERGRMLPRPDLREGDLLLGLASSGVHSNGYSLVRKVVEASGLSYGDPAPFMSGRTLGEALLTPTRIYVKSTLAAIRETNAVKALAHITGGGLLENIPRVLPDSLGVELEGNAWPVPEVFGWMRGIAKLDAHEMHRTFNNGIGMVLVVDKNAAGQVSAVLEREGEQVFAIGRITARGAQAVVVRE